MASQGTLNSKKYYFQNEYISRKEFNFFQTPMALWLREKHHASKGQLIEFEIKQLRTEIKLQQAPLPWAEYTECAELLTEIRDNIAKLKCDNELFLKDEHSPEYYKVFQL